jgi:magnesium transporter
LIALTLLKSNAGANPSIKLDDYPAKIEQGDMLWIDAESPSEQELKTLQDRFELDSYSIEDVAKQNERPKIEDNGKYVFSVIHLPVPAKGQEGKIVELFIFFEKSWIITIHAGESELIHQVDSRIRARGLAPLTNTPTPDLLFYTFLDFAVDAYYPILDLVENKLEELDGRAAKTFESRARRVENITAMMTIIREIRKNLMILRRSLTPTRDMIGMIMRGAVPFVADSNLRSFRDVYDHSFQLLETIDNDRDRTSDVRDLYLSLLTASTDQIVKFLTIVATIFLPLELLAGIYGMNFSAGFFEPGSGEPIGFYVLILAMVLISAGLLYAFRRRGWI